MRLFHTIFALVSFTLTLQAVKFWENLTACWGKFRAQWRAKTIGLGLMSLGIVSLALTACDPPPNSVQITPPTDDKPPHQLTRAIYSAHLQLDPHFLKATADGAPLRDLLVGLMQFAPSGEVVPAVAREFFSEDSQQWLFILDEQAKWSNGEPVRADDFVASWQRLADPAQKAPLADYLRYAGIANATAILRGEAPIETLGVKALNPHTLQINLSQPNPNFPKMLAHGALLPTYRGEKPDEKRFISNGSYRLQQHSKLRLALAAQSPELPFSQVIYQLITTIQNPNRFDLVENPLPNAAKNIRLLPRLCTYFYEFNFNDPHLKQKAVRQAIQAMISPSEIASGFGIPNYFALPKTLLGEKERPLPKGSAEQILHDLRQAQPELGSQPITLNLTYDEREPHSRIGVRIARRLGQSDLFRVNEQAVSWDDLLAKRNQQQFQLIRSGWCADHPDPVSFLLMFHSQSPDNKSGYHNDIVNRTLEMLQSPTISASDREAAILRIVNELQKDVAILPLFQYQRRLMVQPDIHGIVPTNSSDVIYSKDLYRQEKEGQ